MLHRIPIYEEMGRRSKRRSGHRSQSGGNKIVSIPFKQFYSRSLSSGLGSISLHPSQFNRTFEIADNFMLYRFVSLSVEVFPLVEYNTTLATAEAGNQAAVGWLSNITDALGSQTPGTVLNLVHSVGILTNGVCTASGIAVAYTPQLGSRHLRLNRKALVGETSLKWYKATVGTPDSWDELQGYLLFACDSDADPWNVIISGVCEFTSPTATTISPEGVAQILARRESTKCRLRELEVAFHERAKRASADRSAKR